MTSLDGLIAARRDQLSAAISSLPVVRRVPGTDLADRSETTFQSIMHTLAKPEEIVTKAVGGLFSSDPKYADPLGASNYHTQVGFADLARSAGLDPYSSLVVGLGAAILNPLDPLNWIGVGEVTKAGKAAKMLKAGHTVQEGDKTFLATEHLIQGIKNTEKAIASKATEASIRANFEKSLPRLTSQLEQVKQMNAYLKDLYDAGATTKDLELGATLYERVARGQQNVLGISKPIGFGSKIERGTSLQLPKPFQQFQAALVKPAAKILDVTKDSVVGLTHRVADALHIPYAKTDSVKKAVLALKTILTDTKSTVAQKSEQIHGVLSQIIKNGELTEKDLIEVFQAAELADQPILKAFTEANLKGGKAGETRLRLEGLNEEQQAQLAIGGIDDAEAPIAIKRFNDSHVRGTTVGPDADHEIKLLGDYVVIKSKPGSNTKLADALDGIYGQRVWKRVASEDGDYLIQRRMPNARKMVKADDFTQEHLNNLEIIAAQLSKKKVGFRALTPDDFLIGDHGGVQLVNPSALVEYKGAKDAVYNSRLALLQFADMASLPRGVGRELPYLKNTRAAGRAGKGLAQMSYRRAGPASTAAEKGAQVVQVGAHDLLSEAVNAGPHRDLVRASYDQVTPEQYAAAYGDRAGFERANNIEYWRQKIRTDIANGQIPSFDPIVVSKDVHGQLWIAEGRDRLTAAILENLDSVPILNRSFVGEVVDAERGFYHGTTWKLTDLWEHNIQERASSFSDFIPKNYALVDQKGNLVRLSDTSLITEDSIEKDLMDLITKGPQFKKDVKANRINAAVAALDKKFGNHNLAIAKVAQLAEQAPDLESFAKAIEQVTGLNMDNVIRHVGDTGPMFSKLQASSTKMLNDLAEQGVLFNPLDTTRQAIALKNSNDMLQVLDASSNTIHFISPTTDLAKLKENAKAFLNDTVTAADIEPFGRVHLSGLDGVSSLEVKDLVDGTHPRLAGLVDSPTAFLIDDAWRKDLEKKGVVFVSAKNAEEAHKRLVEAGLHDKGGVLLGWKEEPILNSKGQATTQFHTVLNRPEFSYFISPSGELLIGTKQKNVTQLLDLVYQEGPVYMQEFGVMTAGKIILSNPLGSNMDKLTLGNFRIIEKRLQMIAQRFVDLGMSRSNVLDVHMPFDMAVWRQMYGEKVTLGDVLKDDFKLKMPEGLNGHALDITPDIPIRAVDVDAGNLQGVVAVEKTRLHDPRLQKLLETVRDLGDESFLAEVEAGLSVTYTSSYLGRSLTKEAREAVVEAAARYLDRKSKSFRDIESFFKGRLITDLTTIEVNQILKKLKGVVPEDAGNVITKVVEEMRKGYLLKPTPNDAKMLHALAQAIPEGIDFFNWHPLYAQFLRFEKGQTAIARHRIVQALEDQGVVVWSGTPKQLREARAEKSTKIQKIEQEIADHKDRLTRYQSDLAAKERSTPDVDATKIRQLKDQVDDMKAKLGDAEARKTQALSDFRTKHGNVSDIIDLGSEEIYLPGEVVQNLVEKGVVDPADIKGDFGDPLVRVPFVKYESHLDENATKVFLFPPDVAEVVGRYMATTTKGGFDKFLKLYDEVLGAWRSWTLFPIPSYHARNLVSSVFMGALGGLTTPGPYIESIKLFKLLEKQKKGILSVEEVSAAMDSIKFASASGEVATLRDLYNNFHHLGGVSGGLNFNEYTRFGTVKRQSDLQRLMKLNGIRPSSEFIGSAIHDNSVIRSGVSAAAWIENRVRFATFLDAWQKGKIMKNGDHWVTGFDAAMMHTKLVHYDYTDLSAFEQGFMRRVFPFYAWSRHNIPRMVTTFATNPLFHYRMMEAGKVLEQGTAGHAVGSDELPAWLQERFGLVVGRDKEDGSYTVFTSDGFLPWFDAYKLVAGVGMGQMLKDGLTPFVKIPIEQLVNKSMYTDEAIEQYPGQRARNFTLGSIGATRRVSTSGPVGALNLLLNESLVRGLFRPGNEAVKVLDNILDSRNFGKEEPGFLTAVLGLFIGRLYTVDPDKTRATLFKDWGRTHNQIMSLRQYAQRTGDVKSMEDLDNMLNTLNLQYPGKK